MAEPEAAIIVTALPFSEVMEIMQVLYGLMTTDADSYFERADALLVRLARDAGVPCPLE